MKKTKVCIMYDKLSVSMVRLAEIETYIKTSLQSLSDFRNEAYRIGNLHDHLFIDEVQEFDELYDYLDQQLKNILELGNGLFNAIDQFQQSENEDFDIYTSQKTFQEATGIETVAAQVDYEKLTQAEALSLSDNNILISMSKLTQADVIEFETIEEVATAGMTFSWVMAMVPEDSKTSSSITSTNSGDDSTDNNTSTQLRQNSSSRGHSSGGSNSNYGSSSGGYTDKNNSSPESNTENNTTTEEPTENKNDPETKEPAENKEEQTTSDNQTTQNDEATQSPQQNNSNPQQTAPQNSSTSQSNGNNQVIAGENASDTLDSNPTEEVETDIEDNTGDVQGEGKDYTIPTAPTFTDVLEEQLIPKNNESVSNSSVVAPAAIGLGVAGLAGVTTKKAIDKKKKPRENRFIIPQNNFFPEETTTSEDNADNSIEIKDSSHELYEFIKDQMK